MEQIKYNVVRLYFGDEIDIACINIDPDISKTKSDIHVEYRLAHRYFKEQSLDELHICKDRIADMQECLNLWISRVKKGGQVKVFETCDSKAPQFSSSV